MLRSKSSFVYSFTRESVTFTADLHQNQAFNHFISNAWFLPLESHQVPNKHRQLLLLIKTVLHNLYY